jgi:hypothetical protein
MSGMRSSDCVPSSCGSGVPARFSTLLRRDRPSSWMGLCWEVSTSSPAFRWVIWPGSYHAAWDADTRFGDGYPHGVIELTTKRGGQ